MIISDSDLKNGIEKRDSIIVIMLEIIKILTPPPSSLGGKIYDKLNEILGNNAQLVYSIESLISELENIEELDDFNKREVFECAAYLFLDFEEFLA